MPECNEKNHYVFSLMNRKKKIKSALITFSDYAKVRGVVKTVRNEKYKI